MMRRITLLIASAVLTSSCAVLGFDVGCNGRAVLANFHQVGDLVENSNVQSSDVVIGTVQKIELDGWEARVTMCLEEDQAIPEDSLAVVRTTSLLGEKFVDLQTQTEGPPFIEDGHVIPIDQTSKATELEDVFARLAGILGTGNLEQINRFTSAQAKILRDHSDELREVLGDLREFTDVLNDRKTSIADAVDNLNSVAAALLDQSPVLERFLESFGDSSDVLADQQNGLQSLVFSLDRFTKVAVRLLEETESGLNEQFQDLRPVLNTLVANSANLRRTLETLATFTHFFPETMPGDYLQLDVCQAQEGDTGEGTTCPQAIPNDDPGVGAFGANNSTELILLQPLREPR